MLSPKNIRKAGKFFYSVIKEQVTFTAAFQKALDAKLAERQQSQFLRLEILAGQGCQGYTYKFKFDAELSASDYVILGEHERVTFAMGKEQLGLVWGSTLDYVRQMMRETFLVQQNPNAEISCSCKTSFSPKQFLI